MNKLLIEYVILEHVQHYFCGSADVKGPSSYKYKIKLHFLWGCYFYPKQVFLLKKVVMDWKLCQELLVLKRHVSILGYIVRCKLAFEESFYSIQFANIAQFTSFMVLVIKPNVLHNCLLYTKMFQRLFLCKGNNVPSPLLWDLS